MPRRTVAERLGRGIAGQARGGRHAGEHDLGLAAGDAVVQQRRAGRRAQQVEIGARRAQARRVLLDGPARRVADRPARDVGEARVSLAREDRERHRVGDRGTGSSAGGCGRAPRRAAAGASRRGARDTAPRDGRAAAAPIAAGSRGSPAIATSRSSAARGKTSARQSVSGSAETSPVSATSVTGAPASWAASAAAIRSEIATSTGSVAASGASRAVPQRAHHVDQRAQRDLVLGEAPQQQPQRLLPAGGALPVLEGEPRPSRRSETSRTQSAASHGTSGGAAHVGYAQRHQ